MPFLEELLFGRVPIAVGRAAFWGRGEEHETGTDTGLTAIVLEGPGPLGVVSAGNMTALSGCPQSERDMINGWVG
jgi:hypothetical protein